MLKMFRKTERQSLYNVLDEVSPDGFITYNDFKLFIQQADATKDPRYVGFSSFVLFFVRNIEADGVAFQSNAPGQILWGNGAGEEDCEVAATNVHPHDQLCANCLLLLILVIICTRGNTPVWHVRKTMLPWPSKSCQGLHLEALVELPDVQPAPPGDRSLGAQHGTSTTCRDQPWDDPWHQEGHTSLRVGGESQWELES